MLWVHDPSLRCGVQWCEVLPRPPSVLWGGQRPGLAPARHPPLPGPGQLCLLYRRGFSGIRGLCKVFVFCGKTGHLNAQAGRPGGRGAPRAPCSLHSVCFSIVEGLRILWWVGRGCVYSVSNPPFIQNPPNWFEDSRSFFHATCLQKCYVICLGCLGKIPSSRWTPISISQPCLNVPFYKIPSFILPELCRHICFKADCCVPSLFFWVSSSAVELRILQS